MAHEDVATNLDLRLVEPDVLAEAPQQRIAAEPADPEAEAVAGHRAARGGEDHPGDGKVTFRGKDRRGDEHGLAGNRNPDAFNTDKERDRRIAERGQPAIESTQRCGPARSRSDRRDRMVAGHVGAAS